MALMPLFGCAQAQPEEMRNTIERHSSIESPKLQIMPRSRYVTPSQTRRWMMRRVQEHMRVAKPESTREFYFTPKEANDTFSIGDTRDGYLVHGKSVPSPSLTLRQLPVQYERGIAFATTEMIQLLVDTADVMQKKFPKTQMMLGNLGLRDGGDIPYSVSHNSGRDADIGFYLRDDKGTSVRLPDLYKINRKFKTIGADAEYTFDLEKNATLIETLLMHPTIHVQFIFVAKHLRQALLRELIRRHGSSEIVDRFEQSVQNQSAHDDHFHVRIYCSDADICAGCIDRSVIHPWHEDPVLKAQQCVAMHERQIRSKKADAIEKALSIQRLALMGAAPSHENLILSALESESAVVRSAAAFAAQSLGKNAVFALSKRYPREGDARVRRAILQALIGVDSTETRKVVHSELSSLELPKRPEIIPLLVDYIEHYPNQTDAQPLFTAWQNLSALSECTPIARAFEVVSCQSFCTDVAGCDMARATAWMAENGEKSRQSWLKSGFQSAGYRVTEFGNSDIPQLLNAISGPACVSVNAQLILREIGHLPQDSLRWSIDDALWHYTRYFKRRQKKYRIDLSDRDERGRILSVDALNP